MSDKAPERRREDWCRRVRLFPRIAFALFLLLTYTVARWYMNLEAPTLEQSGFASMMAGTSAAFFKFFMSEGKGE